MFLCLSLIPAVSLVSYAEQAPTTLPTTLPDGSSVDGSKLWVDWSDAGVENTKNAQVTEDGYYKALIKDQQSWTKKGVNTANWRGASGIMFYVDASEAQGVDFILYLLMEGKRGNSATGSGCAQFWTSPTQNTSAGKKDVTGGRTGHAYCLQDDGTWKDMSVTYPSYYLSNTKTSGWYYVPLTSFWFIGGSGNDYAAQNDPAIGMNFVEFTSRFENQKIWKLAPKSNYAGLKFGDIHFVYTNPEAAPAGATAPLFGTMAQNGNFEGKAAGTIANNTLTVTAMPNSTTVSNNRIWLKGLAQTNLANGADGIRFHVDTTALGSAQLQLRLRLRAGVISSTVGKDQDTETGIFAASGFGYFTPANGMPQYVCRADNSVAYYYNADGNPVALHVASDVATAPESDLFEALPAGYNGDIYIPFESFWMSVNSYNSVNLSLPFSEAAPLYPVDLLTICHAVSGETTDNTVVYSNFELVYSDTYISGASVTLKNNLDVNFFATLGNATDAKMTFAVGTKIETVDGTVLEDGRTKFVCSGILPQKLNDEITATLTAKVNGTAVSQTMTYSVREYCGNLLAKEDTSETVKKLLVDLLYYAEAAQNYANYKIDDLATKNLTDAQKALRSADTTGAITATTGLDGTADGQYKWVSAALRLENTVAIRIRFAAPSLEGLTVKVTLNGRTVTYTADNITDEGEGYYSILFNNIGAGEYGDAVTAIMEKDGAQIAETLTYSVAAYIREAVNKESTTEKTLALVRALWSYGESAKAVSAS